MTETLKPCPFCGKGARIWTDDETRALIVMCRGIGCYTSMRVITVDKSAAVKKWNTRANQQEGRG